VLTEDDTTSYPDRIPTFHGYSFSGNASAEYVYVGRGQQVDFDRLEALGVELEGKIALAKYGGPFRGLKVKNAQEHGMIGAVIFTDPIDDGNMTEAKGVATYPNGPARNPSSVQRGSVQFLSIYPGDPTTPGYVSKEGVERADKGGSVPHIPSIPISWVDAQPILQALNGFGTEGVEVNRTGWVGGIPGVNYSTGEGSGASLSLSNIMEDKYNPIWDVVGILNGTNEDEVLIIGNHRDAWIVGGAADPNSGSAVLIELAKAFKKLSETGWKPLRTIVLCSWDAEEYGLVGRYFTPILLPTHMLTGHQHRVDGRIHPLDKDGSSILPQHRRRSRRTHPRLLRDPRPPRHRRSHPKENRVPLPRVL